MNDRQLAAIRQVLVTVPVPGQTRLKSPQSQRIQQTQGRDETRRDSGRAPRLVTPGEAAREPERAADVGIGREAARLVPGRREHLREVT